MEIHEHFENSNNVTDHESLEAASSHESFNDSAVHNNNINPPAPLDCK